MPLSGGRPGCTAEFSCQSSIGPPKAMWDRRAGEIILMIVVTDVVLVTIIINIIYIIYCYYFSPVSGPADPQMLLIEMHPVYMLILSPLTSGLLFS